MNLLVVLVFIAAFLVVALIVGSLLSQADERRRILHDRFDAVIMATKKRPHEDRLNLMREEVLSALPLLDRWLRRIDLLPWLQRLLMQSQVGWSLASFLGWSLGLALVVGWLAFLRTRTIEFSVLLGIVAGICPLFYVRYKKGARLDNFEQLLPDALELIVRALRAGHGLATGLDLVGKEIAEPVGPEFRKCVEQQGFGLELKDVLNNLIERVPLHDVRIISTAIIIQRDTGGNLAEILQNASHVIRERARLKRQVRVHTAQGRITGWILAFLPLIMGLLIYIAVPTHMSKLWTHELGLKWMYAAIGMTILGGLIIRKIVRIRI